MSAPGRPGAAPVRDAAESGPLVEARGLGVDFGAGPVIAGLDLRLLPGLTWVVGGEGAGKTALLRLLAGDVPPTAGILQRRAAVVSFERPEAEADDLCRVRDWLDRRRAAYPGWQPTLAAALLDALRLGEHLDKTLAMLSRGTRRKLGLVASAASGAALTLIDAPWAGLDARSVAVFSEVLEEAAEDPVRAWVVADHTVPEDLAGLPGCRCVDLGGGVVA